MPLTLDSCCETTCLSPKKIIAIADTFRKTGIFMRSERAVYLDLCFVSTLISCWKNMWAPAE